MFHSDRKRGLSPHDAEDNRLKVEINAIFSRYKGRVGSPAVTEWLRRQGESVGENRVARLMQEMGIMAKGKRKFRHTTDSNHDLPIAPNHLDRKFEVSAPNKVWVSDITYIPTREGWLCHGRAHANQPGHKGFAEGLLAAEAAGGGHDTQ